MKSAVKQLDTMVEIITPENIQFSNKLAGPFIRLNAFLLDSLFMGILLLIVWIFRELLQVTMYDIYNLKLSGITLGLYYTFWAIVFWFGNAWLEWILGGQTLAKKLFHLRVLTVDGQPISGFQAFVRNVVRMADIMLGPLTLIVMTINGRFMRFGDIAAGTLVIVEEKINDSKLFQFQHPEILRLIGEIPPDFIVSKSLLKVLALYVHTRTRITPQRRWEIGSPLAHRLMRMTGIPLSVDPDLFLCALYQWNRRIN